MRRAIGCGAWVVLAACGVDPDGDFTGGSVGHDDDGAGTTDDGGDTTSDDDAVDDGLPTSSTANADTSASVGTDDGGSSDDGHASEEASTADPSADAGSESDDESSSSGGESDGDEDDDGLPDSDDPFPRDPDLPGFVEPDLIYAHTSDQLHTMEVEAPYALALVGAFSFQTGGAGQVTDAAIDRHGVLYVVTFDDLHVCNPATAQCWWLGMLPEQHNALTFVPPGTIDDEDDSLIGVANTGAWRHLELDGNAVNMVQLGSYGMGYTSSGDTFSIQDVGTYATADAPGLPDDIVVSVDPLTGTVLGEIGTLTGYTTTYGLAGWEGSIFAFDETGDVLRVDPTTGAYEVINQTALPWWGAAVGTVLPQ